MKVDAIVNAAKPSLLGGLSGEREKLRSCYRSALKLAAEHGCESVAFPLISAGIYGYPKDQAMQVAADAIREFLSDHDMTVYLVLYDSRS